MSGKLKILAGGFDENGNPLYLIKDTTDMNRDMIGDYEICKKVIEQQSIIEEQSKEIEEWEFSFRTEMAHHRFAEKELKEKIKEQQATICKLEQRGEKRFRVNDLVKFDYSEIGEYVDEEHTDKPLRNDEVCDLLNEQQELIEELQASDEMGWKRAEMFEKKCLKELHNKKMYIKRLEYKVQKFKEENEQLRKKLEQIYGFKGLNCRCVR